MFIDPSGCIGVMPDGSIYMAEGDTEIDKQLLLYKINYENAETDNERKEIAERAAELRANNPNTSEKQDRWHVSADLSLDYYTVTDITDKLNDLMAQEAVEYGDLYYQFEAMNYLKFYNLVRNGAVYDLKNQPDWQHEQFIYNDEVIDKDAPGNINYGYLGKVMGINDNTLCIAAGAAQIKAGTSNLAYIFSYGDDPRDQYRIKQGINIYKNEHRSLFGLYWGK
jgi:hypothetical protein